MARTISKQEYVHERLGEEFLRALSMYDTMRRVEVLVDEFLPEESLRGKSALDVGTGFGFFAERLQQRGARVTAVDIGQNLLRCVKERVGCECYCVDALSLTDHFGFNAFDVVVSSECIEHTPNPVEALRQMAGVVKPGGLISVSTPNLLWSPIVKAATALRFRPFDGLEEFSTFASMRTAFEKSGAIVLQEKGLHLLPFQFKLHKLSRWCDQHLQGIRFLMINLCVLAEKTGQSINSAKM